MDDRRSLTRAALALAALTLAALALSLMLRGEAAHSVRALPEDAAFTADEVSPPPAVREPATAPAVHAATEEADARDALPHPITAEHLALYRDVDLLDAAWRAARDDGDFARARELLAEHRREYPRPDDDLEEGLSLLVDCMQQPSAETRARAQRFYDERTFSMTRRRIRRHCLEPLAELAAAPARETSAALGAR